jgi:hypothetical protein
MDADTSRGTAVMAMSRAALVNPFTALPTVGPLVILVDAVGGLVTHFRRDSDQWTVSNERAFELTPTPRGGPGWRLKFRSSSRFHFGPKGSKLAGLVHVDM